MIEIYQIHVLITYNYSLDHHLGACVFSNRINIAVLPYRELYEGVSKSFWTGRLDRELQMVQLSATMCSCIAIL
jgi:hypothetical protein